MNSIKIQEKFDSDLNLSNKGLTNEKLIEILEIVENKEKIIYLNISNNDINHFPSEKLISKYSGIKKLNISGNSFYNNNIFQICYCLQSLPELNELVIDLNTESSYDTETLKKIIILSLPHLNILNGLVIDYNKEIKKENYSFYNEIPEIKKNIQVSISFINHDSNRIKNFYSGLRNIIEESIKDINYNAKQSQISYLYSIYLNEYQIYSYISNFLLENFQRSKNFSFSSSYFSLISKIKRKIDLYFNILEIISHYSIKNINVCIKKFYMPKLKENSENTMTLSKRLIEVNKRNKMLFNENQIYKNEHKIIYENSQKEKDENKYILSNIINNISEYPFNSLKGKPKKSFNENYKKQNSNGKNVIDNTTNIPQMRKHNVNLYSQNHNKMITLNNLLELVDEIFNAKIHQIESAEKNDLKINETFEKFIYYYYTQKFGIKKITLEKTFLLINSVNIYAKKNSLILLFQKLYRNELDEKNILIANKLKKIIEEMFNYLKSIRKIDKNNLDEDIIKLIINFIYSRNKSDKEEFIEKLSEIKEQKGTISLTDLFNIILYVHIDIRSRYLKKLRQAIIRYDKDKDFILGKKDYNNLVFEIFTKIFGDDELSKEKLKEYYEYEYKTGIFKKYDFISFSNIIYLFEEFYIEEGDKGKINLIEKFEKS